MDWQDVEETLADFKTQAELVGKAGPHGADKQLGRMLDYVNATPLLKDYIESCQLDIPEKQLVEHLREVVGSMGKVHLDFGPDEESAIARLWRVFGLLRGDIQAIRQVGYGLLLGGRGTEWIEAFGPRLVLRFQDTIARHFRRHKMDFVAGAKVGTDVASSGQENRKPGETSGPKVFVSYAWNGHPDAVRAIVNQLKADGVQVIWDQDNAKPGYDAIAFMEQSVDDPTITKVLVMCDRAYTEKAKVRKGGVGTETKIISVEAYSQESQGKFIPVVLEHDESGNAFRPRFLKNLWYIDLSESGPSGQEYERLKSAIFGEESEGKPEFGAQQTQAPKAETTPQAELEQMLRAIQCGDGGVAQQKRTFLASRRVLAKELEKIGRTQNNPGSPGTDSLTLPLRNACLQITQAALEADAITADDIGDMVEKLHGEVSPFDAGKSYQSGDCVFLERFFNELFICLVGLLREMEDYGGLHELLWRTYFLRSAWFANLPVSHCHFTAFRRAIPADWRDRSRSGIFLGSASDDGTGLFETRELPPCWTKPKIQCADLFLFQMSAFKNRDTESPGEIWLPVTATHFGNLPQLGWSRLVSKRHCLRMLPLFDLSSIDELKSALQKTDEATKRNHWDMQAYSWVLGNIRGISDEIRIEEIGSMD